MKILLNTNESKTVLMRFRTKVENLITDNDFEKGRNNLVKLVLRSMEKTPADWDSNCQINIGWVGDNFIHRLSDEERELSKERLDDICALCFRFLFEYYLSIQNELAMDFASAKRFVFDNINSFERDAKEQIEYVIQQMPISIFKVIANSEAIESIKDFNSVSSKADKLKSDWESEISEKEKRANKLKDALESYENGFNFVGLFQGFDDLAKDKIKEKNSLLLWIKVLSVIIFIPIIFEFYIIYSHIDDLSSVKEGMLISIFPTLSFLAISIYYFRVLLFNFKSVKSHLLQIELRKTLCRFIQSYSGYSSEIKKNDVDSLTKFENIIFSPIVSDDEKLPSSYEGIEQIAKLIKSSKS